MPITTNADPLTIAYIIGTTASPNFDRLVQGGAFLGEIETMDRITNTARMVDTAWAKFTEQIEDGWYDDVWEHGL